MLKTPDPKLFKYGRDFAAWMGLTPGNHLTAGKVRLGAITRAGDEQLRRVLVVGATAVVRHARKGNGRNTTPWLVGLIECKKPKLVPDRSPLNPVPSSAVLIEFLPTIAFFRLPLRGHGSLRGRMLAPHLARSTSTTRSIAGLDDVHPNGCTQLPAPSPRRVIRRFRKDPEESGNQFKQQWQSSGILRPSARRCAELLPASWPVRPWLYRLRIDERSPMPSL